MRDDADEAIVLSHLEAYLMWLFGWIMFCSAQGSAMPKQLLPYVREIADAPLDDVPQYSWGSALFAATYRGLCAGCTKMGAREPILLGCPMFLQIWSYEHFPIGRPRIHLGPYREVSPDHDDMDRPMMGSLWCLRKMCLFVITVSH